MRTKSQSENTGFTDGLHCIFNQAQYFGIAIYDRGFNLNIRIAKKSQQPADQLKTRLQPEYLDTHITTQSMPGQGDNYRNAG